MVGVLDRYHRPGARVVPHFETQQPETQGRRSTHRRPGRHLGRRQRTRCAVAGEQRREVPGIGTPVVGDHRHVEQQVVGAGEIEIKHAGKLSVGQPQDIVAKQVGVDDAARQA